jgi:hypothetical protein
MQLPVPEQFESIKREELPRNEYLPSPPLQNYPSPISRPPSTVETQERVESSFQPAYRPFYSSAMTNYLYKESSTRTSTPTVAASEDGSPPVGQARSPEPSSSGCNVPWTAEEDSDLLEQRARGLSWLRIQKDFFPGKTDNACRKRHERIMADKLQGDYGIGGERFDEFVTAYDAVREKMWKMLADKLDWGPKWEQLESKVSWSCMNA